MNIKDLKHSLEYLVKAQLTPFIWGHAGIGKSSIVKEYARSQGWHFFPLYLGTQADLGDILGLQEFVRDASGNAVATSFAMPIWLKNAIDYCEQNPDSGAIIFLDEFNRGRRDILNGMFSLALDKTFHTIKLPANCHVVAAGNPPTDEYYTTDVNETALMARFVHIKLEPSTAEWLEYAKDTGIVENLVNFIKEQPELLEEKRSSFELPVKIDRRSYDKVNKLFKLDIPEHLMDQLMYGIIGVERTAAYKQFLEKQDKPITADDILAGNKFDKLAEMTKNGDIKASLLSICCDNIKDKLTEMNKNKEFLNEVQKENLMRFLTYVPKDMVFKLMLEFSRNGNNTFKQFYTSDKEKYEKPLIAISAAIKNK